MREFSNGGVYIEKFSAFRYARGEEEKKIIEKIFFELDKAEKGVKMRKGFI